MTRCASLGMYDHPAQRLANDALWARIADELRRRGVADLPATLDRDRDLDAIWRDPELILGQACGYPMITDAALPLRIVALPVYECPACRDSTHHSLIVVVGVVGNTPGPGLALGQRLGIDRAYGAGGRVL